MNTAAEERAVGRNQGFEYEREAGGPNELEFAVGRKVAERIGYEAIAIDFQAAYDVRPVAYDYVRARIYDAVSESSQVTARFTQEEFRPVGDMLVRWPFGPAVKRDDDQIGASPGARDGPFRSLDIIQIVRDIVGGEGYDGDPAPLDVEVGSV